VCRKRDEALVSDQHHKLPRQTYHSAPSAESNRTSWRMRGWSISQIFAEVAKRALAASRGQQVPRCTTLRGGPRCTLHCAGVAFSAGCLLHGKAQCAIPASFSSNYRISMIDLTRKYTKVGQINADLSASRNDSFMQPAQHSPS
jgi:hypothetical protein